MDNVPNLDHAFEFFLCLGPLMNVTCIIGGLMAQEIIKASQSPRIERHPASAADPNPEHVTPPQCNTR